MLYLLREPVNGDSSFIYIYSQLYIYFLERIILNKRKEKERKKKQRGNGWKSDGRKKLSSGEEKIARESTHNVSRGCIGRRKVVGTVSPVVNSVNVEFKPEKSSYYGISEMIDP